MEPIREAEMQTQPGKRLSEESKKSGKGPLLIAGIVLAVFHRRTFRRKPRGPRNGVYRQPHGPHFRPGGRSYRHHFK